MTKTHFRKAFNTPYLGSQDLPDYKDITLTIEKVLCQGSEGLKENSSFNIAYFKDVKKKPMLLNATNSKAIKKLTKSPYIEDWANCRITIYVLRDLKAFGGEFDALRIRSVTAPPPSKPVMDTNHKKWGDISEKVKAGTTIETVRKYYQITDELFKTIK